MMFSAMALVVMMNGEIRTFEDHQGPYETIADCLERIEEFKDLMQEYANVKSVHGDCKIVEGKGT